MQSIKKYASGRRFEYKVRDFLKKKGMLVIRSAGSKSPVDLVGISELGIYLVQCKKGGFAQQDIEKLKKIKCPKNCFKTIAHYSKKEKKMKFISI